MPYATGEKPEIGDVVEAVMSYDGIWDKLNEGDVYKVVASAGDGVHLRGQQAHWESGKFNLICR